MKFQQLDLIAFGPFTGQSINFAAGTANLHLIFGPNEAGKSSSLRAIRNFLFGFPSRTTDAQLHAATDQRIGATLLDAQANEWTAIRRRGRKTTLRASDDKTPADEAQLARMLGAIDREQFCARFGLHYEEMVEGGTAMAKGEGELGQLLFAAASGVADLAEIQRTLQEQADDLFRPKGRQRKINQSIAEWQSSEQRVQEILLRSDDWLQVNSDLSDAEDRVAQVQARMQSVNEERHRLLNQKRALDLVPKRRVLMRELSKWQDVPALDEAWNRERQRIQQELIGQRAELKQATATVSAIKGEIEEQGQQADPLEPWSQCVEISQRVGSIEDQIRERDRNRLRLDELSLTIQEQYQRLGLEHPEKDFSDWKVVPVETQARFESLGQEYIELKASLEGAQRQRKQCLQRVEKNSNSEDRDNDGPEEYATKVAVLREARSHSDKHSGVDAEIARQQGELAEQRLRLQQQWQRLDGWSGDQESLRRAGLPLSEVIIDFQKKFEGLDARQQSLSAESQQLEDRLETLRVETDQQAGQDHVPTRSELLELRSKRDSLWSDELAPLLRDATSPADFKAVWLTQGQPFERLVEDIDRMTDSILEAEERAGRMHLLIEELHQKQSLLDRCREKQKDLETDQKQLAEQWRNHWPDGIDAIHPPRAMKEWVGQVQGWVDESEELERLEQRLNANQQLRQKHVDLLSKALASVGCDDTPLHAEELGAWSRLAQELLARFDAREDQRQSLRDQSIQDSNDLADAESDLENIEQQMDDWRTRWNEATETLGEAIDLDPDSATSVVRAMLETQRNVEDWNHLSRKIDSASQELSVLTESLARWFEDPVGSDESDRLIELLHELTNRVAQEQKRRTEAELSQQDLAKWTQGQQDSQRQVARLEDQIQAMCEQIGASADDDLDELYRLSSQKAERHQSLNDLDFELSQLAEPVELEPWLAELEEADVAAIDGRIAELQGDFERLETERDAGQQSIGELKSKLAKMDGNDAAAQAQIEVESRISRLTEEVEDFCQLFVASKILQQSIQSYREQHQGAVLETACRFFSRLTLQRYQGLLADLDEKGQAILYGQLAEGKRVALDQMSEGTRDQLYLALKLASLSDHLRTHTPLPFMVDDILVKFDDERAMATMQLLAELSEQTQIVMFTHHEHLIEMTRSHLDERQFAVHRLQTGR